MCKNKATNGGKAQIDFQCLNSNCNSIVKFSLADISDNNFLAVCPCCHSSYELDDVLCDKLVRMLKLIEAIRCADDILGDCNVAVATVGGEIQIPYSLLVTRLNTTIKLQLGEQAVDFHLWIEPASAETFR